MRLSDLKRMRESGQRPQAGLLLVRDLRTQSVDPIAARAQLLVGPGDARENWRPIAGLAVHFWPSRWEPWMLTMIERMQAAKPEVLTIHDPVSDDLICVYSGGPMSLSCDVDCGEAWLAAYRAARAA